MATAVLRIGIDEIIVILIVVAVLHTGFNLNRIGDWLTRTVQRMFGRRAPGDGAPPKVTPRSSSVPDETTIDPDETSRKSPHAPR